MAFSLIRLSCPMWFIGLCFFGLVRVFILIGKTFLSIVDNVQQNSFTSFLNVFWSGRTTEAAFFGHHRSFDEVLVTFCGPFDLGRLLDQVIVGSCQLILIGPYGKIEIKNITDPVERTCEQRTAKSI